jgi:hypothetical protein
VHIEKSLTSVTNIMARRRGERGFTCGFPREDTIHGLYGGYQLHCHVKRRDVRFIRELKREVSLHARGRTS